MAMKRLTKRAHEREAVDLLTNMRKISLEVCHVHIIADPSHAIQHMKLMALKSVVLGDPSLTM